MFKEEGMKVRVLGRPMGNDMIILPITRLTGSNYGSNTVDRKLLGWDIYGI